jgi:hypothetical protein
MAFLSWLMSLGHGLEKIAPEMVALGDAGTLAQLYARLTSDDAGNAWIKFREAIGSLMTGVTSDDPFGGMHQARLKAEQVTADLLVGVTKLSRLPAPRACLPQSRRLRRPGAAGPIEPPME